MSLIMMGDISITNEITVSTNGFTRGQVHEMNTTQGIIGNIMMMQIKMTNAQENPYACNKIEVLLTYKIWTFPCGDKMHALPDGGKFSLSASANVMYKVSLTVQDGAGDMIWIQIFGNRGSTLKTPLSDIGFNAGEYEQMVAMD